MTAADAAAAMGTAGATAGTGAAGAGTAATTAGTVGTAGTTATEGGLLAGSQGATSTGLLANGEQAAMLAAQNAGLEGATASTNAGLLSGGEQASMLAEQNAGLLGSTEATSAAADPALTQGMQQPWTQQAQNWLGEKTLDGSGPSRGKLLMQGGKAMAQPQQGQAQAAPAAAQIPMNNQGLLQSASPYAAQPGATSPFRSTLPTINGQPFNGMSRYLRRA
jgi:hypothetical protein